MANPPHAEWTPLLEELERRRIVAMASGGPERVAREHEDIFNAVSRQDPESARAAMRTHLGNSRERLRRALYTAALPASFRWNPQLIALYRRLIAAGKGHKRALIACARKLLVIINAVVARGTPWLAEPPKLANTPAV